MRRAALLLAFLLAAPAPLAAHGVGARVAESPGIVVELYYTDGEAMAFAEARAFSPADPGNPFANSRADRLGRFAFAPDVPGIWRIEARDHEGHAVTLEVPVGEKGAIASRWRQPRTWALFASLALNVLGLAYLFGTRRRTG